MNSTKPITRGQIEDYISPSAQAAINLKANIASPVFTGIVTSPMYKLVGGLSTQFLMADGGTTTLASLGAITGSGVAGQVTFFSGANTLTGDTGLVWDNTNKRLGINGAPAYALDAYGLLTGAVVDNVIRANSAANFVSITMNATKADNTGQTSFNFQKKGLTIFNFGSDINANGTKDFFIYDNTIQNNPFYITNTGEIRIGSAGTINTGGANNTQKLTIKTNGNVLIGTTTDNAGYLLQVAGAGLFTGLVYNIGSYIAAQDLNTLISAGFYSCNSAVNAPTTGYFHLTVERNVSANNIHQTATTFGSGNTANRIYTRVCNSSVWSAWTEIVRALGNTSQVILGDGTLGSYAPILNGVANYIPKYSSATAQTPSRLLDTGTYLGIGTINTPIKDIAFGFQSNREIGVEDSDSNTVGKDLTISGGRAIDFASPNFVGLNQTSRTWYSITASPDGTKIYAAGYNGSSNIFVRTNGSGDFLDYGYAGGMGICVAPNGDVYIATDNSTIRKQTGGVGAFVAVSATGFWRGMCAAPNGDIYCAAGDIYKQTGGVGSFVALATGISVSWVASAPNGDIYASGSNAVFKQTGGVGSFVNLALPSRNYSGIDVAPDGSVFVAVTNGDIYKQSLGVGAFNALGQTTRPWTGLAVDNLGNVYASGGNNSFTDLYFQQNFAVGTSNLNGGTLKLRAGTGKGTGQSRIQLSTGQRTVSGTDMQIETVRMMINEDGNVLIGTQTDIGARLRVSGGLTELDRLRYTKGDDVTAGDLDNIVDAGFYIGTDMFHTPIADWLFITVERHSDTNWVHQTVTSYGAAAGDANRIFSRVKTNVGWTAWKELVGGGGGSITGTGTSNFITKWTGATSLADSVVYDNGTNVAIGGTNPVHQKLGLYSAAGTRVGIYFEKATQVGWNIGVAAGNTNFSIDGNNTDFSTPAFSIANITSNVGIGTASPSEKLQVEGNVKLNAAIPYLEIRPSGWGGNIFRMKGGTNIADSGAGDFLSFQVGSGKGFVFQIAGTNSLIVNASGNTLISSVIDNGLDRLQVNGTVLATGYKIPSGLSTQYLMADGSVSTGGGGGGGITGSGVTNYIPKWSSATGLTNSSIYDNGTNVGIGMTNPPNKLSILGEDDVIPALGANGGRFGILNNAGAYGLITGVLGNGNAYQQIQRLDGSAAAYNLLLQPSGGNVLFGTTTDLGIAKIQVNGAIASIVATGISPKIIFHQTAWREWEISVGAQPADPALIFRDNSANEERMRINTAGDTEFGLASIGNNSGQRLVKVKGSNNSGASATLSLSHYWNGFEYPAIIEATLGTTTGNAASDMVFKTSYYSGSPVTAERMRIFDNGNVGIGTSTAISDAKLTISNGGAQGIEFTTNFTSTSNRILSYNRSSSQYNTLNFDGLSYLFYITGIEKMRLDSAGNLGLGTTNLSGYKLNVKAGNDFQFNLDNDGSQYTAQYFSNNGSNKAFLQWDNTGGKFDIGTITANPLTFFTQGSERARFNSAGRLLLNTTTDNGDRLQVNGTTNSTFIRYRQGVDISFTNIDNLFYAGFYYGSSITGAPTSDDYHLTVEAGPFEVTHQTATRYGVGYTSTRIYHRVYDSDGSTWSAWQEVVLGGSGTFTPSMGTNWFADRANWIKTGKFVTIYMAISYVANASGAPSGFAVTLPNGFARVNNINALHISDSPAVNTSTNAAAGIFFASETTTTTTFFIGGGSLPAAGTYSGTIRFTFENIT